MYIDIVQPHESACIVSVSTRPKIGSRPYKPNDCLIVSSSSRPLPYTKTSTFIISVLYLFKFLIGALLLFKFIWTFVLSDFTASLLHLTPFLNVLRDLPPIQLLSSRYSPLFHRVSDITVFSSLLPNFLLITFIYFLFSLQIYKQVRVTAIRNVGIGIEYHSTWLGSPQNAFIPSDRLRGIFINEGFKGLTIQTYLLALCDNQSAAIELFPSLTLRRPAVEHIRHYICSTMQLDN
ncbi:hypothetical protein CANCADRAFT_104726 [Tortispora caseinolytica NRRL Y-17796]|uniref:Phosphatidylinositol N-acetylglucosaminyltransferase subunit H conserved domain-containing protein n=1 Tax=Tortispora caseinolytica NRRL Y-17796 TaxID=767744 RepID=A0A1E4TF01_9ASCO|nr:hypothetical protein CANCADRAFT_104726 [Tortispora caseinolytica NRRL Y-17796]